jgi:hypothetical protein
VVSATASTVVFVPRGEQRRNGRELLRKRRRDSVGDRRRAETGAEVEAHDIDDMIDAIAAYRRRRGVREIGEELADELLRSTWED